MIEQSNDADDMNDSKLIDEAMTIHIIRISVFEFIYVKRINIFEYVNKYFNDEKEINDFKDLNKWVFPYEDESLEHYNDRM